MAPVKIYCLPRQKNALKKEGLTQCVRDLASHQYDLGSNPGLDVMCVEIVFGCRLFLRAPSSHSGST